MSDFSTDNMKEVMRITKDGIFVNPNFTVDAAAQAVLDAVSEKVVHLVRAAREKDTILIKQALEALDDAAYCVQNNYLPDNCGHDWDGVMTNLHNRIMSAGE